MSQIFAEQERVQWNEHNPVGQTDNANEEDPGESAAEDFHRQRLGFLRGFSDRARNQRPGDRSERSQSVEPVIKHRQSRGPAEPINADDRNQVFERVIRQLRIQRRIDCEVAGLSQHHRVAVGRRLRCKVDTDVAACAGFVIDHDNPLQRLGELVRDYARENIRTASRRKRNDQANRFRRIGLRHGGSRHNGERCQRKKTSGDHPRFLHKSATRGAGRELPTSN